MAATSPALTASDGPFRRGPLPEGRYEMAIPRDGPRNMVTLEARPGKPEVELRLMDDPK